MDVIVTPAVGAVIGLGIAFGFLTTQDGKRIANDIARTTYCAADDAFHAVDNAIYRSILHLPTTIARSSLDTPSPWSSPTSTQQRSPLPPPNTPAPLLWFTLLSGALVLLPDHDNSNDSPADYFLTPAQRTEIQRLAAWLAGDGLAVWFTPFDKTPLSHQQPIQASPNADIPIPMLAAYLPPKKPIDINRLCADIKSLGWQLTNVDGYVDKERFIQNLNHLKEQLTLLNRALQSPYKHIHSSISQTLDYLLTNTLPFVFNYVENIPPTHTSLFTGSFYRHAPIGRLQIPNTHEWNRLREITMISTVCGYLDADDSGTAMRLESPQDYVDRASRDLKTTRSNNP